MSSFVWHEDDEVCRDVDWLRCSASAVFAFSFLLCVQKIICQNQFLFTFEIAHMGKKSFPAHLSSFARYACDPLDMLCCRSPPEPEFELDDDVEPDGEGGPTLRMPRTTYFDSCITSPLTVAAVDRTSSRSELFDVRRTRCASGVNARVLRVIRWRCAAVSLSIFLHLLCVSCYSCWLFCRRLSARWWFALLSGKFMWERVVFVWDDDEDEKNLNFSLMKEKIFHLFLLAHS